MISTLLLTLGIGCPVGGGLVSATIPTSIRPAVTRGPTDVPPQTGRSGLQDHSARIERGQRLLDSLVEHMAPPRHRMEVRVETDGLVLGHTARPDLHVTLSDARRIRAFETAGGWQLESSPASVEAEGAVRPIRARGDRLWDFTRADRRRELRTHLTIRAAFPQTLARFVATRGRVLDVREDRGETHVIIDLPGGRALMRIIDLDYGDQRVPGLVGVDWVTHDDLLGDVVESLTLDTAGSPAPGVVAGWRIDGPLGTFETSRITSVTLDSHAAATPSSGACEAKPEPPCEIEVRPLEQTDMDVHEFLTSWPVTDDEIAGGRWLDRAMLRDLPAPR